MIERAMASDVGELVEFENRVFNYDRVTRKEFYTYIANGAGNDVLIDRAGIGIVGYGIMRYMHGKQHSAWLYSLASTNKMGHVLLARLEALARVREKNKITLEVKISNRRAIEFYHRNGYVCNGLITRFYSDGEDALRYIKEWPKV